MSAPAPREVTHRRVLAIALPIVLSNATVPILGVVDTGVVGRMGEAAPIGAVGLGAIVLASVYWVFGFLRMGTVGLAGQALGEGDEGETAAILTRALMIAGAAGAALIVLQWPVFAGAMALSQGEAGVEALAHEYMAIRVWSAPAAIALYGITGWLIAQERTRAVLVLQVWMNGLNVGLDLWFVLGLGWGVGGVATATLIAEWSALGLGLWQCRAAFAGSAWRERARVLDPARLARLGSVSGDILIRSVLLQAIFTSFLFLGAGLSTVELAANQVLLQFLYVTAYALDGFAFAAEALVAQALGARRRALLRRASVVTSGWGLVSVIGMSAAFALFGGAIVDLMTTASEVRAEARRYLGWMVAAPLVGVAAWMLDGIFIGATQTRDMRNMMVVSFAAYVTAVVVLLPAFGNHGLWAALLISFAVRGITLGLRYPRIEARAA